jgi:ATP-binding protein involved in chromosome partitioning
MSGVSEESIWSALSTVQDPDQGSDIVSLGMVSGLVVKEGNVGFAIEVDPDRGEALEPVRKQAEQAVLALKGVSSVTAVLTAHSAEPGDGQAQRAPHQGARPGQGAQRGSGSGRAQPEQQQQQREMAPQVRHIIAVASGKGGVGKSTTAANIALACRRNGLSVGLLDADIYGPSQPRMMGITGKPHSPDGKRLVPMSNHGISVMSMGFLVEEATPMVWRGPMVQSAIQQMLRDVDWGPLDVLVVDMPPGTGDAQLTLAQQVPLSGAVIITTPQDLALLDATKGLNMFRKVDVPTLGIVENMSYFTCPHCGERSNIFDAGGGRREADKLGTDLLGEIPLDMAIRETSDGGQPIVVAQPDGEHARAYTAIAERIWNKLSGEAAGPKQAPNIVMN